MLHNFRTDRLPRFRSTRSVKFLRFLYSGSFCGSRMDNRITRIGLAGICALLLCALAITARTASITATKRNDSAAKQNTYWARGVYEPNATTTATPCALIRTWTEQAAYPIVVFGNAVASVGGNVYSFGGIANNTAVANAYKYSTATNTWTPIASLPAPRGWFSATSDGTYIYLLGGVDQNFTTTATLWRYDPASNSYNTSLPPYTIPTYFHASVYLNGKIYRVGGRDAGAADYHVEVYNIGTNTWSMAANYPFANYSLMAAALDGYIYAGGGSNFPNKTYRYDPNRSEE